MQINSKISYLTSSKGIRWIKTTLFFIMLSLIYLLVIDKIDSFEQIKQSLNILFRPKSVVLLCCIILLTPLNWALEALKWQKLASKVEQISFSEAYRGVLIGLTFSTATPMMIGDYAGKILMLKSNKRLQSIGAILLGNSLQMYVSLLFGTLGYLFFIIYSKPSPLIVHIIAIIILAGCLVFGVFLSSHLSDIQVFLSKNRFFEYLKKYLGILENYTIDELRNLFYIATARYLVFSFQFLLMFKIFEINLSNTVLLAGIGIIFLTKTIISAINALGDLGVRALTSIYYFSYFGADIAAISSATFMIWLVNVLLPIIFGSIFILQLKLTTKNA
ncbi:lysylphosphatidylglycerol synthase domain-containing protein [Emticicia aquatilis]|uniref:lysylphosphatidylglycerol synthase domain-containing protein n=1 Tax=Emticicia aquatilis TaxID=1537369 RepID=UPI0016694A9B|nr:lysylphosphatidylglycerol synthase domain-containing protein [Emticicia aquatilis]